MKSPRLPLILLSLLCIIFLLITIQQFLGKKQVGKTLKETNQAKDALQNELEEQKRIRADLESQLASIKGQFTSSQAQIKELVTQLVDEQRAKEEALSKFDEISREAETLRTGLESERKEKLAFYATIHDQLETIKAQNEFLIKQIQELLAKREVELEKIVVKPGSGQEGKVLIVNKNFNFIVVGVGSNKGITLGVVFGVYRDGNLIGKAQVEKVYETMSAANILPDSGEIKKGDLAKAL